MPQHTHEPTGQPIAESLCYRKSTGFGRYQVPTGKHEVGLAAGERFREQGKYAGVVTPVGVDERYDVGGGPVGQGCDPGQARGTVATARFFDDGSSIGAGHGGGGVVGTVVYDDRVEIPDLGEWFQDQRQGVLFIEGGDYYMNRRGR